MIHISGRVFRIEKLALYAIVAVPAIGHMLGAIIISSIVAGFLALLGK